MNLLANTEQEKKRKIYMSVIIYLWLSEVSVVINLVESSIS